MSLKSSTKSHQIMRKGVTCGHPARKLTRCVCLSLLVSLSAGCAQKMMNQPRVDPQEATTFWGNKSSMRPLPAHTVPANEMISRQMGQPHAQLWKIPSDQKQTVPPETIDELQIPALPSYLSDNAELRETLQRGQSRYQIWCLPCHGMLGDGNGEVARRGYYYPASFHTPRLRAQSPAYFYAVITQGRKTMPAYSDMLSPRDRWAIAAYVRALQLSQSAPTSLLMETDLKQLNLTP
ncbi:c-type cytochrome [Gimesia chilikensis]|uniref:c-type cytochrome n=1 Tax=Gimesia chilikensis TaxID=2605989 RepID=UPI001659607A|nr:cytochrome c [Gimesia chilikensis]